VHAAWFSPELFPVCILGFGGLLLGLLEMAVRTAPPKRLWTTAFAVYTAGMVILAADAVYDQQTPAFWLPPLLLGAVGTVFLVARLPYTGKAWHGVQWLARKRALQWLVLLFAGPCAGLAWACYLEHQSAAGAEFVQDGFDLFDRSDLSEISPSPATTDAGRPIQVLALTKEQDAAALHTFDQRFIADSIFKQRLFRVAGPDARTNCFGWVFTGGRFWIRKSEDVEAILRDNGYQVVSVPQIGDLTVYRSPEGRVSHVGIVRVADDDGLVLVESKWSWLGLYLHRPQDQCYGMDCSYYRSARGSHILRGLDSAAQATSQSVSATH
jgi:hypothetical protein